MRPSLALAAALSLSCGPPEQSPEDSAEASCGHDIKVTWETGGQALFRGRCCSCHSSTATERYGAPEYLNYDTYEGVQEAAHAIRQAALWDQVMPPGYPLSDEDQEVLESFLDCGL
jgi:uncharacterized membrane protein